MQYLDAESWQVTLNINREGALKTSGGYHYVLREADGTRIQDWGNDRRLDLAAFKAEEAVILDSWNPPGQIENVYYTEPFRQVLLKSEPVEFHEPAPAAESHVFRVKAPLLAGGQTVCLLGSTPALRQWNTRQPLLLSRPVGEDYFSVALDLAREPLPLQYKYGIYDLENRAFVRYEDGWNRTLPDTGPRQRLTVVNDGFANLPGPLWKGAGVAIPVFSLRSQSSFGIGEFADLKLLADWCRQAGLKLIQILPVNDTTATHTWRDSYPYAAISAFALHPVYLNPGRVATTEANRQQLTALEGPRQRLNALDSLDYEAVLKTKLGFLRQIFPTEKERTFDSQDYRAFLERNRHWLEPYAAFCFLRDRFGTADFTRWPACGSYRAEEIAALAPAGSAAAQELAFHRFLQYHLHAQLLEATQYAHNQGVILKGDIAIGVSRYSADAWQQPDLFHTDVQAGAPPDAFSATGQNWSFPTYNWPRMQQTGFEWWKRRFEQMGRYFDAFRIDHILGFFRIWSIPIHAIEGLLGHFVPALPVQEPEFAQRRIPFERERFVRPYITDTVLREVFGGEDNAVKERFLETGGPGGYSLKPRFATQRQVQEYFAGLEQTEQNARLKQKLFDLISNVILLEARTLRPRGGRAETPFPFRNGGHVFLQAPGPAEPRPAQRTLH